MSLINSQKKVLLIGDIGRAFSDAGAIGANWCRIYSSMLDAIETAAVEEFSVIAVVISKACDDLNSALKALRRGNKQAKIVLLAQMYEEPLARRLTSSSFNGSGLADDYLICPVEADVFYKAVSDDEQKEKQQLSETDVPKTKMIEQLEELATTDELTGLKNRRYTWEFGRQIIDLARKTASEVSLLVFDIDDFKRYNDVYGHSAGDEILREAAVLIKRCCRSHDVVGRIGGDEFAVIFWDGPKLKDVKEERRSALTDHPKEPVFIINRFRGQMSKAELHCLGSEGKGVLTISGGLAGFPRDSDTIEQLFERADKALLEAKRSGKNRIYLVGGESDIS